MARRKIQSSSFDPKLPDVKLENLRKTYCCELVTPMYGGGVESGIVDEAMPIRIASIRGHLRFWWRVSRAGQSSNSLLQEEANIWGGLVAGKPYASAVTLKLVCCKGSKQCVVESKPRQTLKQLIEQFEDLKYIFAQSQLGSDKSTQCQVFRGQFGLEIQYNLKGRSASARERLDEIRTQVETALRWWSSFGGLGARTRRGAGSVRICTWENVPLKPVLVEEVEKQGGQLVLQPQANSDAHQAWQKATQSLCQFRQVKGRNGTKGRSHWPEADAIRRIFKPSKKDWRHRPEHKAGHYFPRVAFGLPLEIRFTGSNEPESTQLRLEGSQSDRFASPLILCPYWAGTAYHAAALLLPNAQDLLSNHVQLNQVKPQPKQPKQPSRFPIWPAHCEPQTQAKIKQTIKPMAKQEGLNPLTSFLSFFANQKDTSHPPHTSKQTS